MLRVEGFLLFFLTQANLSQIQKCVLLNSYCMNDYIQKLTKSNSENIRVLNSELQFTL